MPPGKTRGACRLPQCTGTVDAGGFSHETRIGRWRGATPRRLDGTPVRRNNRRLCMHHVSPLDRRQDVGIIPSQQKALSPPTTNRDHNGQPASGQTMMDSGRYLISRRSLLASVRSAITTNVLPRRPRLGRRQGVVPAARVLGTSPAGATLGTPRGIPLPRLTSSRAIISTVN